VPEAEDQYRSLYDLARSMDGVEYIGSVSQARLAQELTGTAALMSADDPSVTLL
jgi:hypothetical protein